MQSFQQVKLLLKGVGHEIFDLHFFHDSTPFGPLIHRPKYFPSWVRIRWDIRSQSDLCGVQHNAEIKTFLNISTFYTSIFSFMMIDVFTPIRISPDFPYKSNQRLKKIFDFDSAVFSLTPQCDDHRGAWLCGRMHTVELDSEVWCTPCSQPSLKMSVFCVFVSFTSTPFFSKNFVSKKDSLNNFWPMLLFSY